MKWWQCEIKTVWRQRSNPQLVQIVWFVGEPNYSLLLKLFLAKMMIDIQLLTRLNHLAEYLGRNTELSSMAKTKADLQLAFNSIWQEFRKDFFLSRFWSYKLNKNVKPDRPRCHFSTAAGTLLILGRMYVHIFWPLHKIHAGNKLCNYLALLSTDAKTRIPKVDWSSLKSTSHGPNFKRWACNVMSRQQPVMRAKPMGNLCS